MPRLKLCFGILLATIPMIIYIYLHWLILKHQYYESNKERKVYAFNEDLHLGNGVTISLHVAEEHLLPKYENLNNQYGLIRNAEDVMIRDRGYNMHAYNCLISQRIGNHRNLPDTRHKLCRAQVFPEKLPKASIVICFYNEHYETLMRSVHSILDRTDLKDIKEIILVDDSSTIEELHGQVQKAVNILNKKREREIEMLETNVIDNVDNALVDYVLDEEQAAEKSFVQTQNDFTIILLKTPIREGLIRARIFGADHAVGDVLVFLDSHIEVNVDWLPPLLSRLSEGVLPADRYSTRAVTPIIDVINPDTFDYTSSPLVRGGFNWGLHFKWDGLPKGTLMDDTDFVKPINSPTMAGGLFAIYREYFNDIGKYDPGMDVWGGENLEISFRIWMCGGSLELIPCSRVGHVFRKRRPYGVNDKQDYMMKNSMRMAHVWMDEYVEKVFDHNPKARYVEYGDISERVQLRQQLQCKSFKWFLDHVYPEIEASDKVVVSKRVADLNDLDKNRFQPWHSRTRNYTDSFQIRLTNSTLCIKSAKGIKTKGGELVLGKCIRTLNQMWFQTNKNELVLARTLCLDASDNLAPVVGKCHELGGQQEWKFHGTAGSPIYNTAAGMCLGVDRPVQGETVVMVICSNDYYNKWDFLRS